MKLNRAKHFVFVFERIELENWWTPRIPKQFLTKHVLKSEALNEKNVRSTIFTYLFAKNHPLPACTYVLFRPPSQYNSKTIEIVYVQFFDKSTRLSDWSDLIDLKKKISHVPRLINFIVSGLSLILSKSPRSLLF